MDRIVVTGNGPLSGAIQISGAKNACLALMPATLLSESPLTLTNAPRLSDIRMMATLLRSLGAEVSSLADGKVLALSSHALTGSRAEYDIVRKMRASILVLGPLLARLGHAEVSLPGGCAIGARPVDLHLRALEAMGAELDLRDGYVHARAPGGRLKGARVVFPLVSVGATENALLAATLAKGTTVLENAAREPEIVDLARCLRAMGARIGGEGTATITVEGVDSLGGATHEVVADRIELGTYMLAPVITGGEVDLLGGRLDLVEAFVEKLHAADVEVTQTNRGIRVKRANGVVRAVDVATAPFPGFPTDLQAQMMALLSTAQGVSRLEETIFENRFMHAPELARMGARIDVQGGVATVTGVERLKGAPVMATDLRASVSLILAGLAAEGETVVSRVYHLDRGYERVEEKLGACGAKIERIAGEGSAEAMAEEGVS
ncbi:UDP-N-acetylglucosamine 1-carboxyvinyltransferase [Rhodovulum sp. 12E13]|uniref:UDP-N-acetylglucosamine 1-carboxyvinyltransferase n=1 Tax=Rhodovulum sp. 12E13 TaxID=2203891 RepID=UPI000E150566|nr:UDP-N-acetylglucosamine 1-carboxyvinyltransferase [Rhodovulum sp. 12E13]RDC74721.1 UDP-N-acetylglucosamine 1-carboxyvinyltransferase [Rhodovulum sp. 12E13]